MNRRQEEEFAKRLDRLELAIRKLTDVIEKLDQRLPAAGVEPGPTAQTPGKDLFGKKERSRVRAAAAESGADGQVKTTFIHAQAESGSQDSPPPGSSLKLPDSFKNSRNWLNLIGVLLLLLGVVFLFKYTADQGWLVPPLRVSFGMMIGLVLLGAGVYVHSRHRHFSQVFSGAGIAALYITGFGAYALYELVPYYVAFAFLASVSLVALALALGQRVETLSLIGVTGAIATPLLLRADMESLPGVIAYICMVLAMASLVYLYKGWRSLLWIAGAGGWIALTAFYLILPEGTQYATAERVALEAGIGFMLLAFWAVPVLREFLRVRDPERWGYRVPGLMERYLQADYERLAAVHVHLLAAATPLAALRLSLAVWSGYDHAIGWATLGVAAVFGMVALLVLRRSVQLKNLAYTHGLVSMALVSVALVLLLDGDALFFSFVVQAALIQLVALKLDDERVQYVGHTYFIIAGAWFLERLLALEPTGTAMLNAQALPELAVVVVAAVLSFFQKDRHIGMGYRLLALLALLGLFYRELSALDNGQGYVTVAWGVCAIVLLVVGLVADNTFARISGLVLLYVVVGKLLLVDLTEVAAIWRILLFIGFGAMFLILSYFYQTLWKHHKLGPPGDRGGKGHSPGTTMQM